MSKDLEPLSEAEIAALREAAQNVCDVWAAPAYTSMSEQHGYVADAVQALRAALAPSSAKKGKWSKVK